MTDGGRGTEHAFGRSDGLAEAREPSGLRAAFDVGHSPSAIGDCAQANGCLTLSFCEVISSIVGWLFMARSIESLVAS